MDTVHAGIVIVFPDEIACVATVVTHSSDVPSIIDMCPALPVADTTIPDFSATVSLLPSGVPADLVKSPDASDVLASALEIAEALSVG